MAEQEELDLAKVQDFIKGQVETYAKEIFENRPAPPVQHVQQNQPTQEELARRQLQDLITPFVKPDVDAVRLVSADTRDYVDFYSDPSMKEEKESVEKMFNELKDAGRPLPRKDIYNWLQGKLASENPEQFSKKLTERQKRQLEQANGSVDFGFGALEKAKTDPVWSNVKNMPLSDLEKALEGVTF